MWFTKSKRAQTSDDFETWIEGGVVPTLNAFDCGDTRATVVIVMREREGKRGGGKGPLLSDRSFTLSTNNFQTLFIIDGTRVGDVRVYEDQVMQTVIQRWGTGGGNVPAIFPIQGTVIGRSDTAGPQGKGYGDDGDPMFTLDCVSGHAVAFHTKQDPINGEVSPALGTTSQGMGVVTGVESLTPWPEMGEAMRVYGTNGPGPIVKQHQMNILDQSQVRRLTPTECERLQGFPDGWTDGQADSHRYKQLGNAVAVPVVEWLINRTIERQENAPA